MFHARIASGPLRRALILENPDPVLDDELRGSGWEVVRVSQTPDHEGLVALLEEHRPHVLFKRSRVEIDSALLAHAPDLFAVMLCCIGDDSVDKQAAADAGVLVLNDPRSNGRSVAEMVVGHILMGARRIPDAWTQTRGGQWDKTASGRFEVKGRRLGVYGLGNIGKQVARLAEALGMEILFYDNDEVAQAVGETMDWQVVDTPEELFAHADVVTVHVSAEDRRGRTNSGLLVRDLLAALGRERPADSPRVFINLSRGFLLDPHTLREAVSAGSVRQAFIDVFRDEPSVGGAWDNPFADEPRIHCTPHIGAATQDAQPRIGRKMARTARLFSDKGTVEDCVFAPRQRIDVARSAQSSHVLAVVHSDDRGTKKAVDDAIYSAGASNLQSAHRDFPRYGIAYDLSVLDRPLKEQEVRALIENAQQITGREDAIRAVRQIVL